MFNKGIMPFLSAVANNLPWPSAIPINLIDLSRVTTLSQKRLNKPLSIIELSV
jgi:hypothetical protein